MIVVIAIVALAMSLIVAASAAPRRALYAVPAGIVTMLVLAEEAGMPGRIAVIVGLVVALLLGIEWRARDGASPDPRDPATIAADAAWNRLGSAAGVLTRARVAAVRKRRDVLVSRDDGIDPFSTFGELRIKLERRVPELIENYLDEAATAPAMRRHLLMSELLGDIEGLVARAEAADPTALARAERRKALKNHLGTGSDRPPIE